MPWPQQWSVSFRPAVPQPDQEGRQARIAAAITSGPDVGAITIRVHPLTQSNVHLGSGMRRTGKNLVVPAAIPPGMANLRYM